VKDGHVKNAAQDVTEGVAEGSPHDVAKDLAIEARAARALLASPPPPPPPSLRSSRLAEIRGNWAAQWHLARAVGKHFRLPGVP